MYLPFARKYRPKTFDEVVGQEAPVRILKNAVRLEKVSNAYLFAGPRGTGKTTIARILTKALNCLNLSDGEPCGVCENCLSIDRGNFPDLIEVDAASNRGIDDIRAIRDAVSYAPIKGRYKVYILDEAHMLTKEAFNALLKTLEEPPPKTVFILCTTEYEKIMPTILSRCQRFIFSKLTEEQIVEHLKRVCQKEGMDCDEKALHLLAKLSDGGMRDALSLLDQTSTYGEGSVDVTVVEEFLGVLSLEKVRDLLLMLINSEVDRSITMVQDLANRGYNLTLLCNMLQEEIRTLILFKSLKNPERVISVEDFHRSLSHVPLNALLYLEKLINSVIADSRTRDMLRAFELAIIKTQIVKDILPLSELLKHGLSLPPQEHQPHTQRTEAEADPLSSLEGKLDTFTLELLRRSKSESRGDRVVFYIKAGDLTQEEMNRIRSLNPRVDFQIEQSQKEEQGLPPFAEKVRDIFGAKIISHEQRNKGKGSSGKGSQT